MGIRHIFAAAARCTRLDRLRPEARLAGLALAFAAAGAAAQPALQLPLRSNPGQDCWIANHVDLDPGRGARDYACGVLTYDAHDGTDLALRDLQAMREGVAVLAAARGTVRAVREGMADANVRETGGDKVRERECGNGLRIDHGEGWETQYCHLKRGSLRVRRGERVEPGQALGLVGLSGATEYPHLHFTLRRHRDVVDPFRGSDAPSCGVGGNPLWDAATLARLPYSPGAIYNYGVAASLPRPVDVREGRHRGRVLERDAGALVVWLEVFGVAAGDTVRLSVRGPGSLLLFQEKMILKKRQARVYRAAGRKRGAEPWPAGAYEAEITLQRAVEPAAPAVRLSFEVR
ncbi:MAG: M23 family metallopeptidase [Betaproteobacteria bacterium]|nr:M23 family metallopeptidase [Betaproteobacteria bacterium]